MTTCGAGDTADAGKERVLSTVTGLRAASAGGVKYVATQFLIQSLSLARGLIMPNLIGPGAYGYLSLFGAISQYSPYVNLGIQTNIIYKVPLLRGQREIGQIRSILDVVFTVSLITGALAAAGIAAYIGLNLSVLPPTMIAVLVTLAALPAVVNMRGIYAQLLRVDMRFSPLSRMLTLEAVAGFALAVAAAVFLNVEAVIAANLVAAVIGMGYGVVVSRYRFQLRLPLAETMTMLKFSFFVHFLYGLVFTVVTTADRLVIGGHLGAEAVGMYAIGLMGKTFLLIAPTAISTVVAPALTEQAGRDLVRTADQVRKVSWVLLFTGFSLALVGAALAPFFLRVCFPRYQAGMGAAELLAVGAGFEALGGVGHYVLFARGRGRSYFVLMVCVAGFAWLALDSLLRNGFGIEAVAATMLILTAIRSLALVFFTIEDLDGRAASARFVRRLIGVGGYATVLALGAAMVFPVTADASVAATAWAGMLRLLVTGIAFGPVVWYFDARTGLIRALALHSVRDLLTKRGD